MYLYNLTLQRASGITEAVHGNFSGSKTQEILISRGKCLELLQSDQITGKLHTLLTVDIFGIVRSLIVFRVNGESKDYIAMTSDSGKLMILEYLPSKNTLEKIHEETIGKTGCRRLVPGQYLAVEPKGRAIMIGAVDTHKVAYVLNRDPEARLTISPPIDANKATLVYHMVAVDVGFENPIFACIECDFKEGETTVTEEEMKTQQTLSFYELNLELNNVEHKYSESLLERANALISVPGGIDGPGGVLLCSGNALIYKTFREHHTIRCGIPRRKNNLDDPDQSVMCVCSATYKSKSSFFFLVQTEQGDIFKVTLQIRDNVVIEIKLKYFDTVPVASSLCILNTGFLFVAAEFGNHYLYRITQLGDETDEPEFSSSMPLDIKNSFYFSPRSLRNLILVDEMNSLSPILACHVADLGNESTPQMYMACGRGPRSTIRILRHGLEVSEMAVSELPGNPHAVWTIKRRVGDDYDAHIVVSLLSATLVFSVGEAVEEVADSGFLTITPTLCCSALGDDAAVQVYPEGFRHIRSDKRLQDWKAPGMKKIVGSAINQRQVVIALTGGELVYFELDLTGQLKEYNQHKEMSTEVLCLALGNASAGEQLSRFLAVGLADNKVTIVSLHTDDCLTLVSSQVLPSAAESLCIVEIGHEEYPATGALYLYIGLKNGVLLRYVLDPVTGHLSDMKTRLLGSTPIKLFRVKIRGNDAVLALSSRCWLSYSYENHFHLTPLLYGSLEYAAGFSSEQCPEGIVAVANNMLHILALEKLGPVLNQVLLPVEYTPRKFVVHPESSHLIILETDHNAYTEDTKRQKRLQEIQDEVCEGDQQLLTGMADVFLSEELPEAIFGAPKPGIGTWASLIRLLYPIEGHTYETLRFEQNEAAVSIALAKFHNQPENHQFVLVGVTENIQHNSLHNVTSFIHTYRIDNACTSLELIHKSKVEEAPFAMCEFQGLLLVGVGHLLRLYDMGKKKLLRKCEYKHIPNLIVNITCSGQRIFVSDVQESVFVVTYNNANNVFTLHSEDIQTRWITTTCALDCNTLATADKFGNIAVLRLTSNLSDDDDDDVPQGLWDKGAYNRTVHKLDNLAHFHVGEICTSLQKVTLIPGEGESLMYTTLSGTIGILIPFTSHDDYDFFHRLEALVRSASPSLCRRDHLSYRSYYYALQNVVDGDLCEQFNSINATKQKTIADDLEKKPTDISRKLKDIRTSYAF